MDNIRCVKKSHQNTTAKNPSHLNGGIQKPVPGGPFLFIWVNYNELTASSLEIIVSQGNHPKMAELFRLVNYYNLPRFIVCINAFGKRKKKVYIWLVSQKR